MKKHLLTGIFSVTGLLLVGKLLGFGKQMIIAATFGAGIETDLISISYGLVSNIQYLLVQVLLTCVVAVYIRVKAECPEKAGKYAWNLLTLVTGFATLLVILLELLAPPVAAILAPSYSQELHQSLTSYLRLFLPMLLCFVWMGLFHALLNANQRFIPGQMEGIYLSVILILTSIFGAPMLGVDALSVGYWCDAIFTAAVLCFQARTYLTPTVSLPWKDPHVGETLRMMAPMFLGYGAIYINQMVDKVLVSGLEAGTITAMSYAAVLSNLVGTLICSLCSVLYAHMSERISMGNEQGVVSLTEHSAQILTIVLLPITIITVCHAEDIVSFVYGRGAFGHREVALSSQALAGYGFSFVPLAWREVYSRLQYSYQNSKGPTRSSLIGIAINIMLSIVFCPIWGVWGVTIASSVSVLVIGLLNMVYARGDTPSLSFRWLLTSLPFLCLAGCMSVLLCLGSQKWFSSCSVLLRLGLSTGLVCIVYGILISPLLYKLWGKLRG